MTKYRHIIWDWNGTLLDDVWLCVEIINRLLAKRGLYQLTHQRYREIFDFPVVSYYEKAGFDLNAESFESICGEFCSEYAYRVSACQLHKHALHALNYCAKNHISQSILSSTEQNRLEQMIAVCGLNPFFKTITGQGDCFATGKIESGKKIILEMDMNAGEILLIGDTIHDELAARKMGIDCALVSAGHHPKEKLKKTGASVFDNLGEIVHVLNNGQSIC